jgi:hypothetical protein
MNINIVAVRRNNQWRGALAVDNVFTDALIERDVESLVDEALGDPAITFFEGDEVSVQITIRRAANAVPGGVPNGPPAA